MSGAYRPAFGFPVSDWFRYYAWRPVETVDRGWRWLRPVWRRRIALHAHLTGGPDFWWQHVIDRQVSPSATAGPEPSASADQHGVGANNQSTKESHEHGE